MKKKCVALIVFITGALILNQSEASDDFPTYGHLVKDITASLEREHEFTRLDKELDKKWSVYRTLVEDSRKPTRTEYTRGNYGGINVNFANIVPNTDDPMSKKREKLIAEGHVEVFRSGRRPQVRRIIKSINTTTKPYSYEVIDTITVSKGYLGKRISQNNASLFFGSSRFANPRKMRYRQQKSQNWNSNSIPGPISVIDSGDLDFYATHPTGDLTFKKTTIVTSFQEALDCPTLSFAKDLPFNRVNVRQMKARSSVSILDKSSVGQGIGTPLLMMSKSPPMDPTPKTEESLAEVSVLRFQKGIESNTISLDIATFRSKMNGAQVDAAFGSCGSSPLYFLKNDEFEHAAGFKISFDLLDKPTEKAYLQLVQNSDKRELMTLLESTDGPILQNNMP